MSEVPPDSGAPVRGHTVPRVVTRPLRVLTPDTSLGFEFIEFCEWLGRPLLEWQAEVARRLLELRPEGSLRFRFGVLVVGRQCGKSEFAALLAIWFLVRRRIRLVVGAAQTLDVAREVWLRSADIMNDAEHFEESVRLYLSNGKERLEFGDGRRYLVKSANRRLRGLSPGLVLVDELREQTDFEGWNALTAMTLAQPEGLVLAMSSGGDAESSVVLNQLLARGRENAADEAYDGDVFLAEYSAPDGSDIDDPASWAYGMPALGRTVTLAAVEALRATLPPAAFRTEVMGQSVTRREESVIDADAWQACADPGGTLDTGRARLAVCLDVGPDGRACLAAAALGRDGVARVELVASWSSPAEAAQPLRDLIERMRPRKVGYFTGPAAALAQDLRDVAGDRLVKLDAAEACQSFAALVKGGRVRHGGQSMLDQHVGSATRLPRGAGWVFARREAESSVTGAYAAAGAVGLARTMPVPSSGRLIVAA